MEDGDGINRQKTNEYSSIGILNHPRIMGNILLMLLTRLSNCDLKTTGIPLWTCEASARGLLDLMGGPL